jgi:hypothetical protein
VESARCLWGLGIGGLQIPIRFGSGSMACKLISPLNRLRGVGSQGFEIMMNGRLAVAIGCRKSIRHFFFLGSSVRRGERTFCKGIGSGWMGEFRNYGTLAPTVPAYISCLRVCYCSPRSALSTRNMDEEGWWEKFFAFPCLPSFSFRQ